MTQAGSKSERVLADDDVAALFGIQMESAPAPEKAGKAEPVLLEQFQAEKTPARVTKTRQNKKLKQYSDSIGSENATAAATESRAARKPPAKKATAKPPGAVEQNPTRSEKRTNPSTVATTGQRRKTPGLRNARNLEQKAGRP